MKELKENASSIKKMATLLSLMTFVLIPIYTYILMGENAYQVEITEYLSFKTFVYRLVILLISITLAVIGIYKSNGLRENKKHWPAAFIAMISVGFTTIPIYAIEDEIFVTIYVAVMASICIVAGIVCIVNDIVVNKRFKGLIDKNKKEK